MMNQNQADHICFEMAELVYAVIEQPSKAKRNLKRFEDNKRRLSQ